MSDDDLEALWIASGPPPEEQENEDKGCLTVILLVASGIGLTPLCLLGVAWIAGVLF